jgi:hypothetical protein
MLPAELGGGAQASVDLTDHLKLELTAVIPSWHLGSFASISVTADPDEVSWPVVLSGGFIP